MTMASRVLHALVLCALCALAVVAAQVHHPRGHPFGDDRGLPRSMQLIQVPQAIEINGHRVLYEDLNHALSPTLKETFDITRDGLRVFVQFQFDQMLAAQPSAKPPTMGRIAIVHNVTKEEVFRMPMRTDSSSRSELRAELKWDAKTRDKLKKDCMRATCQAHVILTNRFIGRSTVIDLGHLRFYKRSSGKTGVKIETAPRLIDDAPKSSPWMDVDLSWSTVLHGFLVLGGVFIMLISSEAWRVHGLVQPDAAEPVASVRWLSVVFICTATYSVCCLGRLIGWLSFESIQYVALAALVVAIIALIMAGGPPVEEEDYDLLDAETQDASTEETKKTL
ncbi:hypothetical protein Poli38472_011091 [Pythium oligandrum]|uniref:Transmembrane protein n=1 Tax=Pythium oligandrum TaxID=41045 RepID=A0A8K1FLS7_PYTOL|nr:hypothetical protein Poli38472_011091 [Pythium oligandrum]|eukprot:TMW67471.1 hypothetical protein Poli38472_011091 [Pythium oligandrum]